MHKAITYKPIHPGQIKMNSYSSTLSLICPLIRPAVVLESEAIDISNALGNLGNAWLPVQQLDAIMSTRPGQLIDATTQLPNSVIFYTASPPLIF